MNDIITIDNLDNYLPVYLCMHALTNPTYRYCRSVISIQVGYSGADIVVNQFVIRNYEADSAHTSERDWIMCGLLEGGVYFTCESVSEALAKITNELSALNRNSDILVYDYRSDAPCYLLQTSEMGIDSLEGQIVITEFIMCDPLSDHID